MIKIETINEAGKQLAETIRQENLLFDGEAIVFIGALGICVRKILPLVNDKHTDPAVVCVDSTGKFVIPVLSGHVGGANELARQIARITGGTAVITTQSDNTGLWPLDTIGRQYGWQTCQLSHDDMNHAIATFVNRRPTALVCEVEDEGTEHLKSSCPSHVTLFNSYEDFLSYRNNNDTPTPELLLIVSPHRYDIRGTRFIQYFPPCLNLGMGCQKDAPADIARKILEGVSAAGFAIESIRSVATIALKKDEAALHTLHALLPWAKVEIYSAGALGKISVPTPSDKVFEVTGCYGVAEAAALAACHDGALVVEKQKDCISTADKTGFSTTDRTILPKADKAVYFTWALSEDNKGCRKGHIEVVGAGPGDPDLVSVRGRKFLERADLILYAGSLVPKELTFCAKAGATVRSSAGMDLEEQFLLMKEFYDKGKLVVRLHTGDPCIYGAIQEQMAFFDEYGMDYHITPGISSFLAAAAELRSQFTIPEKCQTIILTRGEGRTPVPDKEKLHLLAQHQSTMCIFLSASIVDEVMNELLAGGYPPETPVAACYKLTWKEQRIYRGQLKDLANILKENNLTLTTMIVVGEAIDNRHGLSKLYDGHFTHLFRKGKQ